jgi:uncharacterized OB-fold protein
MPRPVPQLNSENRAFWTGGAQGELRLLYCNDCYRYIHPPRPICRHCLSDNVTPKAVAGTGIVETFSVNYQAWYPGLEVPFVVARISIDGAPGVRLMSNIVGCPVEAVDIGDKVRVTFEQQGEIFYPLFERVD